jgi:hypothetical protein
MQDTHGYLNNTADKGQCHGVCGIALDHRMPELGRQQRHHSRWTQIDVFRCSKKAVDEAGHKRRVQSILKNKYVNSGNIFRVTYFVDQAHAGM